MLYTDPMGASPRTILVAGFTFFLLYAYPGLMSSDSVHQLHEARTHVYSNAHPPFMSAEWTILDGIVTGPLLMVMLQGALFLGGAFGLARQVLAPRAAAIAAVAVLLFPPVFATMAVVWKDSQMAAYFVAGTALVLSPTRRTRLLGLVLLSAGCAVRHNGFAAAVPLVGLLFVWNPAWAGWRRYVASGCAAIAVVGLAMGVNRALTVDKAFLTPAYMDIVGILAHCDDRSDEDLRHVLRDTGLLVTTNIQATAREKYDPRNSYHITKSADPMFDDEPGPVQQRNLDRAWRELVRSEWRAYLAHRTAMYKELLGLSDRGLWAPAYFGFTEFADHPDYIEHDAVPSTLQVEVHAKLLWLASETPLFKPYMYALLALVFLVALARQRLAVALLVSGLLYELSFFPTAGTPDCRYSHWMITCTVLAGLVIVVHRIERGRAPRGDT